MPSFMDMALEEARAAQARGEVPVGCVIVRGSEVEHSILLEGSRISDVGGRIESSLIGRNAAIYRTQTKPRSFTFMLGDRSEVGLV